MPGDVKQLTGAAIWHHVDKGWAGKSPPPKGPAPKVPTAVVSALATYSSMQQLAGCEQKGKMLKSTVAALAVGTPWESDLSSSRQKAKVLRRMRQGEAGSSLTLSLKNRELVDNRRWLWNTFTNVTRWSAGWKQFLLHEG